MLNKEQINILLQATFKIKDKCTPEEKKKLIVETKTDGSSVTSLDKELDKYFISVIRDQLKNNDLIISEEDVEAGNVFSAKAGESFWSIDPIDSTNSLINGSNMYCTNIAYIENGVPTFGIIYAPEHNTLWYGIVGDGAYKIIGNVTQPIYTRSVPKDGAVLMSSEEQTTPKEFLDSFNIKEEIKIPSAIKFTYIAEGIADYYTRKRNKACDWDIASGHAIIVAAGGSVEFKPEDNFQYGKPPYTIPSLLATGKK